MKLQKFFRLSAGALAIGLLCSALAALWPTPSHALFGGSKLECTSKTANPSSLTIPPDDGIVVYTIAVKNPGSSTISDITLSDPLGTNVAFVSATPAADCSESGGTVTCNIATLDAGNTYVATITADLSAVTEAQLTNTATVSSTQNRVGSDTCEATVTITRPVTPGLVCLSKEPDPDTVPENVAANIFYQIIVSNDGDSGSTAENVVLMDPLSAYVTFVDANTVPGQNPSPCLYDDVNKKLVCSLGDIDAGAANNQTVLVQVLTKDNLPADTVVTNTATVAADNVEPDSGDSCTANVQVTEVPPGGCRVTGGGVDEFGNWDGTLVDAKAQVQSGVDRYQFGGQAGANTGQQPQPKGEWTHHQQRGPDGSFIFHAGTASAPEFTEIDSIVCSDEGACHAEANASFKQIDFDGYGTFKNMKNVPFESDVVVDVSLHYFTVHIEDLGEPGNNGKQPPAEPDSCPAEGSAGDVASCDCPDYYWITIHKTTDPNSDVLYEVRGYLEGGNLQIHPPTGFDTQ